MTRSIAAGVGAALLLTTAAAVGQPGAPTFRAQATGVRVDVLATRSGAPLRDLTAGDFELLDNGVPQVIQSVDREDAPLEVTLALDVSSSVSGGRLASLTAAAGEVLDRLAPADRATLLTFQRRLELVASDSADRHTLRTALADLRSGGATALVDAAYAGLMLAGAPDRRALLLVFTDGRDTGSWLQEADVMEAARVSNVVAYGVATPQTTASGPDGPATIPFVLGAPPTFLEQVADATGGRVLQADWAGLGESFQAVLAEFRSRYVLTYSPSHVDSPGWHTIEVRLRSTKGEVRARPGYVARPTGPSSSPPGP
jgi:VWFA-related protein